MNHSYCPVIIIASNTIRNNHKATLKNHGILPLIWHTHTLTVNFTQILLRVKLTSRTSPGSPSMHCEWLRISG